MEQCKRLIFITTTFEGTHRYDGAPDEVSYLRFPHRHMFGVKVTMEVFHDDREVEFILLKHAVNSFIQEQFCGDNAALSCEMMADTIRNYLLEKYPHRRIAVEVNEDNENGAIIGFFAQI